MSGQDLQGEHERVIAAMRRQLDGIDAGRIDYELTRQKAVDQELARVRKAVQNAAISVIGGADEAYKGVRVKKYRRVFGGNVNILTKGRPVYINSARYNRPHKRHVSERTRLMESYWGPSRSFILRWTETGTRSRTAGTRYGGKGGRGNRGAITARSFFRSTAESEMRRAANNIIERFKIIIDKQFNRNG